MRLAAAALALALSTSPVHADFVLGVYTVSATGFSPAGPPEPFSFKFAIAFDTTVDITDSTAKVMLLESSQPLGSPLSMTYDVGSRSLFVGGLNNGAAGTSAETNDFAFDADVVSTTIVWRGLVVTQDGVLNIFKTDTGTIQREELAVFVSAPGGGALLGVALLGLAAVRRRRAAH